VAMIRAREARLKMSKPLANVRIRPVAAAIDVLLFCLANERSENIAGAAGCVELADRLWRLFRHSDLPRDCRRSFGAEKRPRLWGPRKSDLV
jgi:hypothetical protein